MEYYGQLIELLKEDKTFEKMLQILFGPMLNVTEDDIKELRDVYGLLEEINQSDNDKTLVAFSPHFQEYLSNLGRKVDFWSLWTTLEVRMREVITSILKEKHGDKWFSVIASRHPEVCQKAEETRQKSKDDDKVDNLLYYFDAMPLFEIILHNKGWNDFKDLLGGDKVKKDLTTKAELIVQIRNPYAHSRFKDINPTKVKNAEIYCNEILDKLK